MKVTDWFGPDVKPTIPGVYETQSESAPCFQYWTGDYFDSCADNAELAAVVGWKSMYQTPVWRGLAEKP